MGVAKTTTAVNLAAGLTTLDKKVLLVDMDPQANATETMPIDVEDLENNSVAEVLTKAKTVDQVAQRLGNNLAIVPSHIKLARLEPSLVGPVDAYRLKEAVESLTYDFVVIDCPPSLGAPHHKRPHSCDRRHRTGEAGLFGLSAVNDFMETVRQVKSRLNPELNVLGILITMHDARTTIAKDVVEALSEEYGELLFKTRVTVNVQLDEAASARQSIFKYDPKSSGAQNYRAVLAEVVERAGK